MITYTFEEEKLYASKSGICPVCGKRATRNQKFSQTVNPFNKTKDGVVKTWREIRPELKQEADVWRAKPTYHSKCEPQQPPFFSRKSSRIAAHDMGFDYWGCELDCDYYREGEARFKAHRAKPVLFAPEQMYYPEQIKMF